MLFSNAVVNHDVNLYSGPVLVLTLARVGAVQHWKNMLGPSDVDKAKDENPDW